MARFLPVVALLVALAGCAAHRPVATAPSSRQGTVTAVKSAERELGFGGTANFAGYSDKVEAYFHCYYTGKLELPASYEGLHLVDGTREGCAVDESRYDVFFYPMEAVAGANTPVTTSLEQAPEARFSVVVAHEDFHDMDAIRRLPTRFSEAAATLVGFLTAAEQSLALGGEAELYRRKAEVENRYWEELREVYGDFRAGRIDRATAAVQKEQLYDELKAACRAITPDPASFNKCPAALNNAGLAFDATYTRYYPLLYQLHIALGSNAEATVHALLSAPREAQSSEKAAESWFRRLAAD